MTRTEQGYVINFLERFGQHPSHWTDNWALFYVLNHAVRKALGARYDQAILDEVMLDYLDKVYCGDGWYDDAPQRGARHFDSYLTWGFGMHVLQWAMLDGTAVPQRRDVLLERVRRWMMHFPYFFASDGAYCEYGRSLCYKFGRTRRACPGLQAWRVAAPCRYAQAIGCQTPSVVRRSRRDS